jgi:heptosyltransferase-3
MKILVMKFRNIGDVLLITPLIENLKRNYPDSIIDVALNEETKEMITLNPNVNKIHSYPRNKIKKLPLIKKIKSELSFIFKIRKEKYDMVINLTKGDRGAFISLFSGAKTKVGFIQEGISKRAFNYSLPLKQGMKHTLEWDLDALRVLNKEIFTKKVSIYESEEDKQFIENLNLPNEFVHFHPVSRWLFKCIKDDISAQIIDFIQDELNIPVIITAAPVKEEIEKVESILKLCKSNPINLTSKLSLKQTSALNKKAKFFVGVDTAIMHISAANNIPVIAFFGPSGAFHWGPWDNNLNESEYKNRNGYQEMGKHKVIQHSLECAPCGQDGCNGSKISDCLMSFDMDFVKNKIKETNENS